jgi:hypothetical protein
MKTEGRRAFVRNMMIGVPVVAGSSSLLTAANAAPAPVLGSVQADRQIDAVLRQIADLHNEMRARVPTTEDAARAATYLRSLIGYRREAGRDAQVTSAFRHLVDERGVAAIAALEPDQQRMRAGLAYYGIDGGQLTLGPISPGARSATIDRLSRRGVESYYEDFAEFLYAVESGNLPTPSACALFQEAMKLFEAMVATLCLGATLFPPLAPECFAATVALTALKLMSLFMEC